MDFKKESKFFSGCYNHSAFDSKTNTLVIYNPIDNFIRFYNCAREIENFKDRIKLISSKDDEELKKESDYKLIRSRNSVLNLIEKNVNISKQEHSFISDPTLRQNIFEPFLIYLVKNKNLKREPYFFRYWLSSFFMSQFTNDDINIFDKDELISISSLAFVKNKEPVYILGTNKGKLYLFPIFFELNNSKYIYYMYQMSDEKSSIQLIYFKKNMILFSNSYGRFVAIELDYDYFLKRESDLSKAQTYKKLISIDLAPLKKLDIFLLNPIKRILQVKLLNPSIKEDNEDLVFLKPPENLPYFENCLALILDNNSVAIFSISTSTVDYILKANEGAILGVFFHCSLDQIFVLNSTGDINVWSISTGNFERCLSYKNFYHHFNLSDMIKEHSQAFDHHHNYNIFKTSNAKNISKLHSVLEFSMRADEKLIDYDKEASQKKSQNFELNNERFGDLERIVYNEKESSANLIWMLNYANDLIFESKSKKNASSCLKLKLTSNKLENISSIGHILVVDCKKNLENKRKYIENKEKNLQGYLDFLSFIFPFGISQKLDEKIFKKIDNKLPVFNFSIGIQGIGETFSFLLKSSENWSSSSYLSSLQAIAITVRFIIYLIILIIKKFYFLANTSINAHSSIRLIEKTLEILCQKEKRTKIHPFFKGLNFKVLSKYCVDENNEIMSSACNLIVASLLNFEGNPDEIYNLPFNLFLSNLNKLEQSNGLLSKMEVVCMMLTGYSLISLKPNEKNNLEIILQRILSAIELFLLYSIF